MGRRLVARHLGAEAPRGKDYKDDSLSYCSLKKVLSSPLTRAPTDECSGAQSALENMHRALEQKHKGVPIRVTDDRGCCLVAVFGMVPHQSPMRR
jgi:hypothetical protein